VIFDDTGLTNNVNLPAATGRLTMIMSNATVNYTFSGLGAVGFERVDPESAPPPSLTNRPAQLHRRHHHGAGTLQSQ